jgi:hypothetical protein
MKLKQLAATGLLAALFNGTAATTASAAETSTDPCPPDTFPAWVTGNPHVPNGVKLWHDDAGWHVRVKHAHLRDRTFSAVIGTGGQIGDVKAIGLERGDWVKTSADKHQLVFKFHNHGFTDGVDFTTTCAPRVGFGFTSDGRKVPTRFISIGADGKHPRNNPFRISHTA